METQSTEVSVLIIIVAIFIAIIGLLAWSIIFVDHGGPPGKLPKNPPFIDGS